MTRAFEDIAFTDSVKAAQQRYGSRYNGLDRGEMRGDHLTEYEIDFLAERDSFYMASVGKNGDENGWPYIQHRGGPKGFLKVLDDKTIGFADFRGNRQYISVGNLNADDRVTLFIMDYPNRQRLKIWARARVVDMETDADMVARLSVPGYPARVERGVILTVEALDWNCPQHITPRFSEEEVRKIVIPLLEENRELKEKLARMTAHID
ncbi:MAG TPA: pyridoxamine 5'-phosphate oxidase family protein [Methylophilaceae bacterium]